MLTIEEFEQVERFIQKTFAKYKKREIFKSVRAFIKTKDLIKQFRAEINLDAHIK